MMSKIEKTLVEDLNRNLKLNIEWDEQSSRKLVIYCGNKCRLLSHLFHKAGLEDIHVTLPEKEFEIIYNSPYSRGEIYDAIYEINKNAAMWLVEFIEKYYDNEFMMSMAFKEDSDEASA